MQKLKAKSAKQNSTLVFFLTSNKDHKTGIDTDIDTNINIDIDTSRAQLHSDWKIYRRQK
jgi:hypothetical protein